MVEEAEISKETEEIAEAHKHGRFNRLVAITVAVLALVMVLGRVKEDNLGRRALATLMQEVDQWNYYQDKSLKQHMFELQIQHWQLVLATSGSGLAAAGRQQIAAALQGWQTQARKESDQKAEALKTAQADEAAHEALEEQEHGFSFAQALMTLAVTLFAVSALVQSKPLYGFGLGVAILGLIIQLGGFLGWNLHLAFLHFLT
jgi:heme/copper-type cytochrome/quinol oxidase subunit 4